MQPHPHQVACPHPARRPGRHVHTLTSTFLLGPARESREGEAERRAGGASTGQEWGRASRGCGGGMGRWQRQESRPSKGRKAAGVGCAALCRQLRPHLAQSPQGMAPKALHSPPPATDAAPFPLHSGQAGERRGGEGGEEGPHPLTEAPPPHQFITHRGPRVWQGPCSHSSAWP